MADYDNHRAEALRLAVAYMGPGQPPKGARTAVGVARVFEQFLLDGTVLDETENRRGSADASQEPVPAVTPAPVVEHDMDSDLDLDLDSAPAPVVTQRPRRSPRSTGTRTAPRPTAGEPAKKVVRRRPRS